MARLNEGAAPGQRGGAPESQVASTTPRRPLERGTSRPQVGGPPLEAKEVPTYRKWNEAERVIGRKIER